MNCAVAQARDLHTLSNFPVHVILNMFGIVGWGQKGHFVSATCQYTGVKVILLIWVKHYKWCVCVCVAVCASVYICHI